MLYNSLPSSHQDKSLIHCTPSSLDQVLDSTLPCSHQVESLDAGKEPIASSSDARDLLGDASLDQQPLSPNAGLGRDRGREQGRSGKPRQSRRTSEGAALPGWLASSTRLGSRGPPITNRQFLSRSSGQRGLYAPRVFLF